ncbi:MAG: DUF1887 family protein [Oscillospiraceae bacterium]|nr:DUF1887 family protein [Oscillospiraceae bacterium]
METLIELYDNRPLENVLATEMFRPVRTVFVYPEEIPDNKEHKRKINRYLAHRGIDTEIIFRRTRLFNAGEILTVLRSITDSFPDCAIDITGGTDDALFAAGRLSADRPDIPVFTYSRRKNRFFSISNAAFASDLECPISYKVEDIILMAGGALHTGRVDNSILSGYMDRIEPFYELYINNKRDWVRAVEFIQQLSGTKPEAEIPLHVHGDYFQKGERGGKLPAPEKILREYEEIGFISDLCIEAEKSVEFRFSDLQIRAWMRDVGSVLELYAYKVCVESGSFDDVITSAVVDWEGESGRAGVSNEIDVVATKGVMPVFISCKTCDVKTEAINELSILRDRFGGEMAKAYLITTGACSNMAKRRAAELRIGVIDSRDIASGVFRKTMSRI